MDITKTLPRDTMPEALVWNYRQVAAALGVCERTVYTLAKTGQLRSIKVMGNVRFQKSEVEAYLDSLVVERDTQSQSESVIKD